jgi:hypothetical protein
LAHRAERVPPTIAAAIKTTTSFSAPSATVRHGSVPPAPGPSRGPDGGAEAFRRPRVPGGARHAASCGERAMCDMQPDPVSDLSSTTGRGAGSRSHLSSSRSDRRAGNGRTSLARATLSAWP